MTEKPYETIPEKLPYEPIFEINEKEWMSLVRHVKKNNLTNRDANVFMWKHLYKMHSWVFIDLSDKKGFQPLIAVIGDKPSIILFTSVDIANKFIRKQNLTNRFKNLTLSSFLIPSTLSFLEKFYNMGVEWVNFNQGTDAPFGGPIYLLETGYIWHLENDPDFNDR